MRLSRYNDYDMNPQHTEVVLTNLVFIILQGLIAVTSFVCYCSYVFIARQHSDAQFCLSVCLYGPSAISNDLERTQSLFSRLHHFLTLNISKTATDTAIVYRRRI